MSYNEVIWHPIYLINNVETKKFPGFSVPGHDSSNRQIMFNLVVRFESQSYFDAFC